MLFSANKMNSLIERIKSKPYAIDLLVLIIFFIISWPTYGTFFGGRGIIRGDDWYILADDALGQLPGCVGVYNFIGPWRPLQPTLYCLVYSAVGPNLPILFLLNTVIYAATAFAWYGVVKNVFGVSHWVAFSIG